MDHLVNQENMPRVSRAAGKAVVQQQQLPQQHRAVLGQIQNVGRSSRPINQQPVKAVKSQASSFPIFCDDSSSSRPGARHTTYTRLQSNKENLLPKDKQHVSLVQAAAKLPDLGTVLRTSDKPVLSSLPRNIQQPEPMNTSLIDTESPMLTECSSSSTSTSVDTKWRVPPTQHNQTVDICSFPEYAQDIFQYLLDTEEKHCAKSNYMSKQSDITHGMRSILVDWLVEVGEEYKLQTETLHLAVNYIDRFLSTMAVQRSKLQLVGAACMFIAAKYEEIYPPDVGEFVYITDDTYNKRQVLRMEHLVLKVLDFDLAVATSHLFLHKMLEMYQDEDPSEDNRLAALASYLAELVLVEGQDMLKFSASQVAASCVAMARHTLDLEAWPDQLALKAGYAVSEIRECFVLIHGVFSKASSAAQQAVRDKYKTTKFFSVSELSPPDL